MANRSYQQYCGLARALDLVGERWNLLIVRELLPGPRRYTELKSSLTGIASNLLAERLRSLEENGILQRELGSGGVVYGLTSWGAELREPMEALGRWAAPLLASGQGDDAFEPRWLVLALPALLRGVRADPAVQIGVEIDGWSLLLRVDKQGPHASDLNIVAPAATLAGSADMIVALAAGAVTVDQARPSVEIRGDARLVQKVFPSRRESQNE